jgi:ribosomal subunit interface protein
MKLEISGQRIEETQGLSAHIERRLRFTLGRFGARVGRVAVTMADLHEPRGGIDKQCRMTAAIVPKGKIIVDVNDADMFSAVDRAADRLGRVVAQELERRREQSIRLPETVRLSATTFFRRQPHVRQGEGGII